MEEHLCEVLPPWNNQLEEARFLQRKPFPPATVRILSDSSQHKSAFVCSCQIKEVPGEGTNVVLTRNELLICLWHPVLLHIHPYFPVTFDSNVISVLTRSDQKVNQIGDVLHVCHSTLQSLQVIGNLFDNVEMTFSCFASNPIYSVSVDALYSRIKCIKTLWIGKMLLHQLDH